MGLTPEQFIETIRTEWKADQEKSLSAESQAREALKKQLDDHQAFVKKGFEDQQAYIRSIIEKSARPPFSGAGELVPLSLGERFVQSEQFKSADKHGRFSIKATFEGQPIATPPGRAPGAGQPREDGNGIPPFINSTNTGWQIWPYWIGVVRDPEFPLLLRTLIDVIPINSTNAVEYVTEDFPCNAGYQLLEGDRKPQGHTTYTPHIATVVTIAWWIKISRQMMDDVPTIVTSINNRLVRCILEKEERELLMGEGTPGTLKGIFPVLAESGVPEIPAPAGAGTPLDQVLMGIAQVRANNFQPDVIVLNGVDWARMQGLKNSFGGYLLPGLPGMAGFSTAGGAGQLWGLPVAITPGLPQGRFLVGQFRGTCAIFDRQTVNIETANQNEDDFIRNLIVIRAEERLTFAVFQPNAFATGDFSGFNFNGAPPAPPAPEGFEGRGPNGGRRRGAEGGA
jgi:hypothetical protein